MQPLKRIPPMLIVNLLIQQLHREDLLDEHGFAALGLVSRWLSHGLWGIRGVRSGWPVQDECDRAYLLYKIFAASDPWNRRYFL
jgi:hypothetical protein